MEYDEEKEALESQESIVRQKVMSKLPKDWQSNYRYYLRTYMHGISYVAIFFASYKLQEKLHQLSLDNPKSFTYNHPSNSNLNIKLNYPWYINPFSILKYSVSVVVAWSIHSMVMIGHDAVHGAFAPSKSRIGKLLTHLVVKGTWDGLVATDVQPDHYYHHRYFNTKEDTTMIIIDSNLGTLGEVLHTLFYSLGKWNAYDFIELFNPFINPFTKQGLKRWIIDKPWLLLMIPHRLLLYFGVYYDIKKTILNFDIFNYKDLFGIKFKLRPLIGLSNVLWTAYMFNIFAFSPHISPNVEQLELEKESEKIRNTDISNDQLVNKLRNTWETFPNNTKYDQFQQWIHCGLTMHATHHCFSYLPRSLMHIASKELKEAYPQEYRGVYNVKDEIEIWNTRKVFAGAYDIDDTKAIRDTVIA